MLIFSVYPFVFGCPRGLSTFNYLVRVVLDLFYHFNFTISYLSSSLCRAPSRLPGLTSPSNGRIHVNSAYSFTPNSLPRDLEFNPDILWSTFPVPWINLKFLLYRVSNHDHCVQGSNNANLCLKVIITIIIFTIQQQQQQSRIRPVAAHLEAFVEIFLFYDVFCFAKHR